MLKVNINGNCGPNIESITNLKFRELFLKTILFLTSFLEDSYSKKLPKRSAKTLKNLFAKNLTIKYSYFHKIETEVVNLIFESDSFDKLFVIVH